MRPSSSSSDTSPFGGLLGPLSGAVEVDAALSDTALLQAMLDVERALVRAQAKAGLVQGDEARIAADVDAACQAEAYDADELGRAASSPANPVPPLVRELRSRVPDAARRYVHNGATSQDVLDTALVLLCRRSLVPLASHLTGVADALASLAEAHRATVMAGRTLAQQALPTTFGLKAAGWLQSAGVATDGLLRTAAALPLQFGGATGTLASFGADGVRVMAALADELDLPEPVLPWHTDRTPVAGYACALGSVCGALGKVATDVVALAQTEVAEVVLDAGAGGSSTLPHKRNPVEAIRVRAAAVRAPGLVATLLASMDQPHERAAGEWQAEWEPLRELVHLTGGAAAATVAALAAMNVDAARMRANLDLTDGLVLAEAVATRLADRLGRPRANEVVQRAAETVRDTGRSLRDVLLADDAVTAVLDPAELDAALDPAAYLGAAGELVDRALAAHAARRRSWR
jgi:3-carboxy-cis,cis-muconate cycloisomerase